MASTVGATCAEGRGRRREGRPPSSLKMLPGITLPCAGRSDGARHGQDDRHGGAHRLVRGQPRPRTSSARRARPEQFDAVAAERTGKGMLPHGQGRALAQGYEEGRPAESQLDVWRRTLPINRGRLVVFNDEGHHCWERASGESGGIWTGALHALASHPDIKLAQVVHMNTETSTPAGTPARSNM